MDKVAAILSHHYQMALYHFSMHSTLQSAFTISKEVNGSVRAAVPTVFAQRIWAKNVEHLVTVLQVRRFGPRERPVVHKTGRLLIYVNFMICIIYMLYVQYFYPILFFNVRSKCFLALFNLIISPSPLKFKTFENIIWYYLYAVQLFYVFFKALCFVSFFFNQTSCLYVT